MKKPVAKCSLILLVMVFCPFVTPTFEAIAAQDSSNICLSAYSTLGSESKTEGKRLFFLKAALQANPDLKKFSQERYGDLGPKLLDRLNRMGERFRELVVDPGIVLRIDSFEKFVAEHGLSNAEPWAARDEFSKFLGKRKVYRGLVLTDTELKAIQDSGLQSAYVRSSVQDGSAQKAPLVSLMVNRLSGAGGADPFLSVTEYPGLAAAVAKQFQKLSPPSHSIEESLALAKSGQKNAARQVYVFELSIPELDLIAPGPTTQVLSVPMPKAFSDYITGQHLKALPPHEGLDIPMLDPRTESLVLFGVNKEEIVKATLMKDQDIPEFLPYRTGQP